MALTFVLDVDEMVFERPIPSRLGPIREAGIGRFGGSTQACSRFSAASLSRTRAAPESLDVGVWTARMPGPPSFTSVACRQP